jgi:hypothetical protein
VLKTMRDARHTRRIQIINGLKPKLLRQALEGKQVGTIIYADQTDMPAKNGNNRRKAASRTTRTKRKSSRGK